MIEVDDRDNVEQRVAEVLPGTVVWGEVAPCQAAMLVLDRDLGAAA